MNATADIFVANGTRHWLPGAEKYMRATNSEARVYVVVFREPGGRIGFDLNEIGEKVFGDIVGLGHSWSKDNRPIHFEGGSSTKYVRSLFVGGLSTPITVSNLPLGRDLNELSAIKVISSIDPDDDQDRFSNEIALFASKMGQLCVHSVAQWVTTVLTTRSGEFLSEIEDRATSLGIRFNSVIDERLLPQW